MSKRTVEIMSAEEAKNSKDYRKFIAAFKRCDGKYTRNPENIFFYALAHHKVGDIGASEKLYKKLLEKNSNNVAVVTNLSSVYLMQRNYEKCLSLLEPYSRKNPNNVQIHENIANALEMTGEIFKSIEVYWAILKIDTQNKNSFNSLFSLFIQGCDAAFLGKKSIALKLSRSPEMQKNPFFLVLSMIYSYQKNKIDLIPEIISTLRALDSKSLDGLGEAQKVFFSSFFTLVYRLIQYKRTHDLCSLKSEVYFFGDSHCLSYANNIIDLSGVKSIVRSKLIFGAKAYQLGVKGKNKYKALLELGLSKLDFNDCIFISFGEIDCRLNEGIIHYAQSKNEPIDKVCSETAFNYVQMIKAISEKYTRMFIVTPPPHVFDKRMNHEENELVKKTSVSFSEAIKEAGDYHGVLILDIHKKLRDESGYGISDYFLDFRHLRPEIAIKKLESAMAEVELNSALGCR